MRLIYNIAAVLAVILMVPAFFIRGIREQGFVERIKQQLGFLPKADIDRVARKNCIWIHAASVGEIVAASPIIKEIHRELPKSPILVTVFTNNGYAMAKRIIKDADSIIYMPFDLPWITPRLMYRLRPRIFMPVETELWPNLLQAARNLEIPVMMVNGRISEKSVKSYRYLGSLWDSMRDSITRFAMQSPIDMEYILRLGANPQLVSVTGNTKYDQTYTNVTAEEKQELISSMGLTDNEGVFLAGSTHPGEEELVLDAFDRVREKLPGAKLIIAPRAILRAGQIAEMCSKHGFSARTRTELNEKPESGHDVVILNTIGELGKVYSIGDVIYVGGSLIPHGGHNILEPAAHGKAIITGCNMFNFKETHALFSSRSAVITVDDGAGLTEAAVSLFDDKLERQRMEQATLDICNENRGAARRTAVMVHELLECTEKDIGVRATERIENFQTYFYHMINGQKKHSSIEKAFINLLQVFSYVYGGLVKLKLAGYRVGLFKQKKLDCFVISLGNITVGGTGKTPTAYQLATYIRDLGYKVVILNRGYRSKWHGEVGVVSDGHELKMDASYAGDEAFMLAKHLPQIPVLIGPERAISGQYAIDNYDAEVAILDDGFQHWQLQRDLDIVLVDAVNVFGNGYMLPRGTLREPMSHLARADVFLLTKVDQAADGSCQYIKDTISRYNDEALLLDSVHQPKSFIRLEEWADNIAGEGVPVSFMSGKRVMAVSAIGNPASFEHTIGSTGAEIIESLRFPDHHDFTADEFSDIISQAAKNDVEAIIITEKDAVKVPDLTNVKQELQAVVPIYVITITVKFLQGEEAFKKLIADRIRDHVRKG